MPVNAIHLANSVDSFKAQLKTRLFSKDYPISLFVMRPCSGMVLLRHHINCRNSYFLLLIHMALTFSCKQYHVANLTMLAYYLS